MILSKRARQTSAPLSALQIAELKRCLDAEHFIAHHVLKLNPEQRTLLGSFLEFQHTVAKVQRGIGTTSLLQAYLLWEACFNFPCRSLMSISHNQHAAYVAAAKFTVMLMNLPQWLRPGIQVLSKSHVELENGCRVRFVAAHGNVAKGLSLNTVAIDSLALLPDVDQSEMLASIMPCFYGNNAKMILASDYGQGRDAFSSLYQHASNGGRFVGGVMNAITV